MDPVAPDWQTASFWKTLIALLWPIIAIVFKINPGDSATMEGMVQNVAATGFSFVLATVAVYSFIHSRLQLKKSMIEANVKLANGKTSSS